MDPISSGSIAYADGYRQAVDHSVFLQIGYYLRNQSKCSAYVRNSRKSQAGMRGIRTPLVDAGGNPYQAQSDRYVPYPHMQRRHSPRLIANANRLLGELNSQKRRRNFGELRDMRIL